jgi:hypothetical protein
MCGEPLANFYLAVGELGPKFGMNWTSPLAAGLALRD